MNYKQESLRMHKEKKGKLSTASLFPLETMEDLSLAYTPGVAEPCVQIAANPELVWDLTMKGRTVAVVTDGTAVLGLGNIGPEAGLPVMEGKCIIYKRFSGLDAVPICLNAKTVDEIVAAVVAIAPTFGAIQLEDIAAPHCFEVQERLEKLLPIPVMQDDQYGTAVVVLAGLINALKVVGKKLNEIKVVVNGAGAAGLAVADLLLDAGVTQLKIADSKGILYDDGKRSGFKLVMAKRTNPGNAIMDMKTALADVDVFIGVSQPNLINADDVKTMAKNPIVFAMANPDPEILPEEALRGGAAVVATGRSDFPNQVNNALAFPGLFLGVLEARLPHFEKQMYLAAAHALAEMVATPSSDKILPTMFEPNVARIVADAVKLSGNALN